MTQTTMHPLQQARKKLRLKQKALADLTGLSEPTIKRAERGEPLEDFTISAICKYFSTRYGRPVDQHELGLHAKWETKDETTLSPVHITTRKERVIIETMHEKEINASDGCFSFGKIKTTGLVLEGDGASVYLPQHIRTHYVPVPKELPEELQAKRNQIQKEQEQKKEQGLPFFWNGEIYSLDRFVISREPIKEGMTLDLWFRPSDYYTFQATNMSLDDPSLREKYLKDVDWYETIPHFSHSFGISLVVITSDGYTLLTQRSPRQGSNAGCYSISANEGLSRPLDRGTSSEAPDLYRCALRGLAEELGLREPADFSVSDITFLSFEVDTQYALWGILGMVKVQKTTAHILENWQGGVKDKMENKKLFPVPFTPQDVCSFVFSRENWTPGGLICLYHTLAHEFGRQEVDKIISSYK
jgi:DNA-binding XRE family transcriptional regulator